MGAFDTLKAYLTQPDETEDERKKRLEEEEKKRKDVFAQRKNKIDGMIAQYEDKPPQ